MTVLPIPTLDHVVINARDRLDDAEALYTRLGFHLTPRGYHSLGSINHLAIFGTDYLELIALPPGSGDRSEILQFPTGLNGFVFGMEDAAATHAALEAVGAPVLPPQHFVRPVALPDGPEDAAFTTIRLPHGTVPAGRLYFCQHFTRTLVWRDEWRRHANGTVGVAATTICSDTPEVLAGLLATMFGPEPVSAIPGGQRLMVGLSSLDIVTPAEIVRRYGAAAPEALGRKDYMVALTLRTTSLDQAAAALAKGGIVYETGPARILVPASETMGATLEFIV